MPFDITFTEAEFEAAITTDPKIAERLAPVLTRKEYAFRDKAANTVYEKGLLESHTAKVTGEYTAAEEKDIFETTGVKRGASEAAADYRKRVLKAQKEGIDTRETELAGLRGKSDITAVERAKMLELETSLKTQNENFKTERQTLQDKINAAETRGIINSGLATIRPSYLKAIPLEAVKHAEAAIVAQISKEARLDGENVIYVNADGTTQRDPVTQLPYTTEDKLKAALKAFIDPGFKQAGAGSAGRQDAPDAAILPAGITTQTELVDYLLKQESGGKKLFPQDSVEFIKEFNRLGGKTLPIRK